MERPHFIANPNNDVAGVDWIFANEWFPYQRPSFVTPPFAGYVSGHSTFSRAAAEVLSTLTGDPFFPGGMGTFDAQADTFLKFEKGPLQPLQLQWATYRDASDQTSLSRIWGGIHPPIDDIPGRIIGEKIGRDAFTFAENYFIKSLSTKGILYPNPVTDNVTLLFDAKEPMEVTVHDLLGREMLSRTAEFDERNQCKLDLSGLGEGVYFVLLRTYDRTLMFTDKLIKN